MTARGAGGVTAGYARTADFLGGADNRPEWVMEWTASVCQGGGVELPPKEASMEQATTIGLDIAKHVFHVHGADAAGHLLFRKRITRVKLLGFLLAAQARCVVCDGSLCRGALLGA